MSHSKRFKLVAVHSPSRALETVYHSRDLVYELRAGGKTFRVVHTRIKYTTRSWSGRDRAARPGRPTYIQQERAIRAHYRKGMVVVSVDGHPIKGFRYINYASPRQLLQRIERSPLGFLAEVATEVDRKNRSMTAYVTLCQEYLAAGALPDRDQILADLTARDIAVDANGRQYAVDLMEKFRGDGFADLAAHIRYFDARPQ